MTVTFTKLFSSITESTVWCEDNETRIVWITMLAMANKNGFVFGSVPGLANRARVPVESARAALAKFMQPDPDSRTKDYEGRRVEEVDGGWRLLNYHKHRAIRDEEERREYMKNLMRAKRAKSVSNVSHSKPPLSQAEAEAEAEAGNSKALAQLLLSDCESIYNLYPRKIGKASAIKAIGSSINRLVKGEYKQSPMSHDLAVAGLRERVRMFADSPDGRKGKYTPHPSTWFNRSSYLDDPKEWGNEENLRTDTKAIQRARNNQEAILAGLGIGGDAPSVRTNTGEGFIARRVEDLESDVLARQSDSPEMGIQGASETLSILPKARRH